MAKRLMNEEQMIDMIWGAALLAGGGGGSINTAMVLLNKYKEDNPDDPLSVTIIDPADMEPGAYAAATAAIGSPISFMKKKAFLSYATNAYSGMLDMYSKMDPPRDVKYSYAAEMGGFNTFVPMMISQVFKIPFIDADGAGRAVPAMNTLLLHVNGNDAGPMSMSDDENNRIAINLEDPRNAALAEELGRNICAVFGNIAGATGWPAKREDFDNVAIGTITLSEKIGHILRECAVSKKDVFSVLNSEGVVECRSFGCGKVVKAESVVEKGFDYGKVVVDADREIVIYFQNENLLCEIDSKPVLTVPDITCTFETSTCLPLTNADIHEGMEIAVGAIKVDEKWWNNPDMFDVWAPLLKRVGYTGGNVPY